MTEQEATITERRSISLDPETDEHILEKARQMSERDGKPMSYSAALREIVSEWGSTNRPPAKRRTVAPKQGA